MCLYVGHCDGIAIIILEFLQENAYSTFSFYMNFRVSNSMKIRRFRWNRNNRNKFIGINNVFTLDLYNRNWLLDVVTVNPLNLKWYLLEFSADPSIFLKEEKMSMYIYLYIDVAMVLLALVEILRITLILIIIEKCKRH